MIHQTLEKLSQMNLSVMGQEYRRQAELPATSSLPFEDRLAMMVDAEWTDRRERKLKRLLKAASLRIPEACLENVDFDPVRKIDRSQFAALESLAWIKAHQNLIITGACGTGKTWLASAFGDAACRQGLKVLNVRVSRMMENLRVARNDGTWGDELAKLKKPDLLILDDFGLSQLDPLQSRDFHEIAEDRINSGSVLMTSQLPVINWHDLFEEKTAADGALDRLVRNSHRIELHGPSRRPTLKNQSEIEKKEGDDNENDC